MKLEEILKCSLTPFFHFLLHDPIFALLKIAIITHSVPYFPGNTLNR